MHDVRSGRPTSDWLTALLASGLLAAAVYLSDTSLYWLSGLSDMNLDIAMMLTPWGMLHNLWLAHDAALKPFYAEAAARHGVFQDSSIGVGVALVWGLAIGLLFSNYRSRTPR